VVATALSVIVGVTSAFLGGVWDEVLSLLSNVFLVIPALPLLIVLLGYLQTKGQTRPSWCSAGSAGRGGRG
jgi:peptide/nickel transport system permease protein